MMNRTMKLSARDREIALRSELLADLEPRIQRRVLEVTSLVACRAREVIIALDSTPRSFFAVLSGHVRLYRVDARGREADIAVYGPGDVFGECSMFLEGCYPFQVQAAEAVTLAAFDIAAITSMMKEEPPLLLAIGRVMARHSMDARLSVANDRLNTAPQRVAKYLLETWRAQGGPGNPFRLPFQKSLLAGKLGLAPEALSRAFAMLQKTGVSISGRMVQITDAEALENF
jgi:CRP/FNR family transcriptional regulator, dissimilatory nitrate respiration regulator